jgi:GrpB-like predicted nucleotidyltransferase (UPF0157 family)
MRASEAAVEIAPEDPEWPRRFDERAAHLPDVVRRS